MSLSYISDMGKKLPVNLVILMAHPGRPKVDSVPSSLHDSNSLYP
jgi:hypothetical protein